MSNSEKNKRRQERRAAWDIEQEERARAYGKKLSEHPATEHLNALANWERGTETLVEAVEYLLTRARDNDVGAP